MKKVLLFVVVAVFFSAVALAASPEVITASVPAGTSIQKLEDCIVKGAAKRGWGTTKINNGLIEATIRQRQHTVVVAITYDASKYTITYKDSVNMKYNAEKNSIHRNYNRWVQNLDNDIYSLLVQ